MSSDEQVQFVREAIREELRIASADLDPGVEVTVTGFLLDRLARVSASATMAWLIEATKDGQTGGTVEVNADDALRGE